MHTLDEDPGKLAAWLLRFVVDVWIDEGIRKALAHIMAVVCLECATTQTNQSMQAKSRTSRGQCLLQCKDVKSTV